MLGISVFPALELSLNENLDYIKRASSLGISSIFSSLHVKHASSEVINDFIAIITLAYQLNMDIMVDISPQYMNKVDLLKLPITALRLDFGFSDQAIVKLSQQNFFRIQLNASTIDQNWANNLIKRGINLNNIDACHNYYPRRDTGLSLDFFRKKNLFFKSLGLHTLAFVPSFYRPRGALFEGLPTLEIHRYIPPFIGAQQLFNEQTDIVIIGDAMASDLELKLLLEVAHSTTHFLLLEITHDIPLQYETLLHQEFTVRADSGSFVLRAEESRSWVAHHRCSIKAFNSINREAYSLTIDNEAYLQYQGELQIILSSRPADHRVNVIGSLSKSACLINQMKPQDRFKFIIKKLKEE